MVVGSLRNAVLLSSAESISWRWDTFVGFAVVVQATWLAILGSDAISVFSAWNTFLGALWFVAVVVGWLRNARDSSSAEIVSGAWNANSVLLAVVVGLDRNTLRSSDTVVVLGRWDTRSWLVDVAEVVAWFRHASFASSAVVVGSVRSAFRFRAAEVVVLVRLALFSSDAETVVRAWNAFLLLWLVTVFVGSRWNAFRSTSALVVGSTWHTFLRSLSALLVGSSRNTLRSTDAVIVGWRWNAVSTLVAVVIAWLRDALRGSSAEVVFVARVAFLLAEVVFLSWLALRGASTPLVGGIRSALEQAVVVFSSRRAFWSSNTPLVSGRWRALFRFGLVTLVVGWLRNTVLSASAEVVDLSRLALLSTVEVRLSRNTFRSANAEVVLFSRSTFLAFWLLALLVSGRVALWSSWEWFSVNLASTFIVFALKAFFVAFIRFDADFTLVVSTLSTDVLRAVVGRTTVNSDNK